MVDLVVEVDHFQMVVLMPEELEIGVMELTNQPGLQFQHKVTLEEQDNTLPAPGKVVVEVEVVVVQGAMPVQVLVQKCTAEQAYKFLLLDQA
jgi:hypothetical protein